jgi:hypothetical protein
MKTYVKCGDRKPLSEFRRNRAEKDGLTRWCRACMTAAAQSYRARNRDAVRARNRQRMREYRAANRDEVRDRERQRRLAAPERSREGAHRHHQKLHDAVFGYYGQSCACCGSTERLTIDHVNGGGREDREKHGYGTSFYRWLITSGFPSGFQTLCQPCNASKGTREHCRRNHQRAERAVRRDTSEAAGIADAKTHPDPYASWVNGEPPGGPE